MSFLKKINALRHHLFVFHNKRVGCMDNQKIRHAVNPGAVRGDLAIVFSGDDQGINEVIART